MATTSNLRPADGDELMDRFGKSQPKALRSAVDQIPTDGAPAAPAAPAASPSFLRQSFPAISQTLDNNSANMKRDLSAGNYAGAVGSALGGTLRLGNAALDDMIAKPYRELGTAGQRAVAGGVVDAANSFVGSTTSPETKALFTDQDRTAPGVAAAAAAGGTAPPPDPTSMAGDATGPGDVNHSSTGYNVLGASGIDKGEGVSQFNIPGKTPLFTNLRGEEGRISNENLMNRQPMTAQNQGALDGIQGRQDAGDANRLALRQYNDQVAGAEAANRGPISWGDGGGYGLLSKEAQAAREAKTNTPDNGGSKAVKMALIQAQTARDQSTAMLKGHQMNNDTSLRTTSMNNDSSLRTTGMNNDTSLRTTDMNNVTSMAGHKMTNRLGLMNALREQGNADRTFQAGRDDAGAAQKLAGAKALHEEFSNMLPPTMVDGKPVADTAGGARMAAGWANQMASNEKMLRENVAAGKPGAKEALAELTRLGAAAYGPADKQRFVAGMTAKDATEQTHSGPLNPTGGRAPATQSPVSALRPHENSALEFGKSYDVTYADGSTGSVPARQIDGDGSFIGGRLRTDMNSLKK